MIPLNKKQMKYFTEATGALARCIDKTREGNINDAQTFKRIAADEMQRAINIAAKRSVPKVK